jgi:alkylated DNA repair protein (DNA oxidative demethylase)
MIELAPGAVLLQNFAADDLWPAVQQIADAAPFRHMITPGGFEMSVAMTNCGPLGWTTDRTGYHYSPTDPQSGRPWPTMPSAFLALATAAAHQAGFPNFTPDACLINRYHPGAKMSLHQDKDEYDFAQPIVSVSLGLPAIFLLGGFERSDKAARVRLHHGDVVVWGGPARLRYHGVLPIKPGEHPLTGPCRINLTLRAAAGVTMETVRRL